LRYLILCFIREGEIGEACSTLEGDENHTKYLLGNLKGGDRSEDLSIDGKIILEWILCIHLSQDRDQWRTIVNTIMNLWVP
jgi:hypothetical protein